MTSALGAGDADARLDARGGVILDDLPSGDLHGADTAVVRALRCGVVVALDGPAHRAALLEERVLLLDAEPGLLILELLGHLDAGGSVVGDVGLEGPGKLYFTEDQHVVAAAERVRRLEHRSEHAVRVRTRRLVGGGAIEAPGAGLLAVLDDLGLRPHQRGGFGSVDPDVLGSVRH